MAASDAAQLKSAREDIKELLRTKYCHPILVRLGWHDSGTYDKNIEEWPQRGGADGSLRFDAELNHGANAGLINSLKLIQPIKDKYPGITYADLFQLASATAIEEAGGPTIPMKYGRVDVTAPEQCPPEGRLPDAGPRIPAEHLREVFYRMGLDDKDIVALSGAHTLGRSRPDRSGWGKPETKYTVCFAGPLWLGLKQENKLFSLIGGLGMVSPIERPLFFILGKECTTFFLDMQAICISYIRGGKKECTALLSFCNKELKTTLCFTNPLILCPYAV